MESSSDHNPESGAPRQDAEGRLSVASSSSTSSFNSIVNTNEDMGIMEDDEDDDHEVGGHKPNLPPISPQSSGKNLTTPANGGTTGYDSSRIPAAVFSRKPTNRMEWSVASNESLFSIHMGNNSFSMGQDIMLPFEVNNEVSGAGPPSGVPTTVEEGVENRMSSISSGVKEEEEDHSRIPKKDDKNHSFEITHVEEPMIPVSTGGNHGDRSHPNHVSTVSRESGTSSSSFAFPLLASDENGTKKRSSTAAPEQPVTAMVGEETDHEKSKSGQETTTAVPEGAEAGEGVGTEANPPNTNNGGEKKSSWFSCFSCFKSCSINCKTPNQASCFAKGNNGNDNGNDKEDT